MIAALGVAGHLVAESYLEDGVIVVEIMLYLLVAVACLRCMAIFNEHSIAHDPSPSATRSDDDPAPGAADLQSRHHIQVRSSSACRPLSLRSLTVAGHIRTLLGGPHARECSDAPGPTLAGSRELSRPTSARQIVDKLTMIGLEVESGLTAGKVLRSPTMRRSRSHIERRPAAVCTGDTGAGDPAGRVRRAHARAGMTGASGAARRPFGRHDARRRENPRRRSRGRYLRIRAANSRRPRGHHRPAADAPLGAKTRNGHSTIP